MSGKRKRDFYERDSDQPKKMTHFFPRINRQCLSESDGGVYMTTSSASADIVTDDSCLHTSKGDSQQIIACPAASVLDEHPVISADGPRIDNNRAENDQSKRSSTTKNDSICGDVLPSTSHRTPGEEMKPHNAIDSSSTLDVGNLVGKRIDDFVRKDLLLNPWVPPKNYRFPFSEHSKNAKVVRRFAGHQHLDSFHWLAFSHSQQGYFCKYCPFLVNDCLGGYRKNVVLGKLVTEPLRSFARLLGRTGDLVRHSELDYHIQAVEAGKKFVQAMKNPEVEILNQIDTYRLEQIRSNRARLMPIIKTLVFCGRQNIPIRGHRDDGGLNPDESVDEGNFKELLKFRVESGDSILKSHLQQSSSRATYISKTTQNELIDACAQEITSVVIGRAKKAKFVSVIFDETLDISLVSQLTVILRYYLDGKIYEDFVKFVDLFHEAHGLEDHRCKKSDLSELKMTGIKIGTIVRHTLIDLGMILDFCVAITCDGCSVNISESCGAVSVLKQDCQNAVYSPCYSHKLNLTISKSSSVQAVRNSVATMKETISFFKSSAKRVDPLKALLGRILGDLCETRWVERHDGVLQFRENLPKIVETLDVISSWRDSQTAAKARALRLALCDSQFLVALVSLSDILSLTHPLSVLLQKSTIDVVSAESLIKDITTVLERKRERCDTEFQTLYEEICEIANQIDVDLRIPRTCGHQNYRDNHPAPDHVSYFRRSIYIPLIDHVLQDLKSRFSESTSEHYNLFVLLPNTPLREEETQLNTVISSLATKYYVFFDTSPQQLRRVLKSEIEIWYAKWLREGYEPTFSAVDFLQHCDEDIFPTVHTLLRILVTIPYTAASAERSFSTLKRVKSWLRSTMGESRLVGLALMNVHRDIMLDLERVLDRYASMRRHRHEFMV
ncbi:hypothetical protein QAD02_017875 [Eretmocerus hayati]|uniref:Uncharacterized protein n=1 Tax=Eretmocerus hayati TaxID=131215 RepID=A0ACC2PG76_9HYME|nr:hypothetical protein QAD02_017875 [Eretmocerus hayati]